jgi:hypothetical protein
MSTPVNVFIAASVVLWLVYRGVAIVRDSARDAVRTQAEGRPLGRVVLDGTIGALGRLAVLLGTAFAISCAITLAHRV